MQVDAVAAELAAVHAELVERLGAERVGALQARAARMPRGRRGRRGAGGHRRRPGVTAGLGDRHPGRAWTVGSASAGQPSGPLRQGPVMAKVMPGVWMFTNIQSPWKVAPANSSHDAGVVDPGMVPGRMLAAKS